MKRLICVALLLALAVCAVAEEDLTLDMPAAEDIAIESDTFPEDAPVEIAPEEDLLLPEDIDLELSGGNMESEAEGLSANAAEATGAASNRVIYIYTQDWQNLRNVAFNAKDGDTIILLSNIQQTIGAASFKAKNITLNMNEKHICGASWLSDILDIREGGELTLTGDGVIQLGGNAVSVVEGCALTLDDVKIVDCGEGVYNSGNFSMTGSAITGCDCGVNNSGAFTMTGGEITGNKQGVVAYFSETALTVSGYVKITGNSECDVLLKKGQVVAVGGPLTRSSRIGVTLSNTNLPTADRPVVLTRGLKGNGTADNFVVWGDYEKRINDDGELEVCIAPNLSAAADYTLLARLKTSGGKALKLSWTEVGGADGYDVFFGKAGQDARKKATVTSGASYRFKGLKKGVAYRAYVKAWAKDGGKKRYIGKASPNVFAIAGGHSKTRCNPKSISVNKSSLKLSAGKSAKIRAKVKGTEPGMKLLHRDRHKRFYSSNVNVATVDVDGKVKAVAAGECTIWVLANNGLRTGVKVKVK